MAKKQYFLRSGNGELIHVPIQIQSANDSEFLGMLAHENTNTDENSESSSDREQNEEVVVGQSSTEQTVSSENNSVSGRSNAAGSSVLEGSTQQAINLQILYQICSIGKWLDAIEKKGKNKTNDASKIKGKSAKSSAIDSPVTLTTQQSMVSPVPNLHDLRSDALIQAQVEQRLRDLVMKISQVQKLSP